MSTSPLASLVAVSIEASRRFSMPGFTSSRSTTTSMVWLRRLSSGISSSSERNTPSIRARTNPWRASFSRSFLYSPLRPRTTGASTMMRSSGFKASTCCKICSVVWREIWQEHGIVVGVGAIPGIGEPEILPDDDAVAVAGFVELVLADLAHPVADHVEIHFRVIAHGGVVFAGAVAQHAFAEAPTAALGNEAAAVDPHFERAALFAVGELADARLELFGVGNGVGGVFELQAHVVEIGRAVSGGPPQLRVDELQGVLDALELGGGEGDGEIEGLGAEASAQRAGDGGGGMILKDHLDLDGGTGGIGERQDRADEGIPQGDGAGSVEVDAVPDTGFAAADGGDPIPPDGSVKGGIIRAESAAVLIGAHHGGFLDAAGRGGFEDAHSDGVFAAGEQLRGHIEAAADEGALDAAEFFAVEEDFDFPIDAVEVEPDLFAGKCGRGGELVDR